jgi:arylsulfatase A-like enzyme
MSRLFIPSIVAVTLLFALAPAQAGPITFSFLLTATADSVTGPKAAALVGATASGSFTYDDALLDAFGNGTLAPGAGLLGVDMTFLGVAFDETNDLDFDLLPEVGVAGFEPIALSFWLASGSSGVLFPSPFIASVSTFELEPGGATDLSGPLYIETVPLPATLALLLLGLVALAAQWRQPSRGRTVLASVPLLAALAATGATATPAEESTSAPATDSPNILFVMIDDIGIDQMRSFGYRLDNQPVLPTIDTIAEAGVRFRNAWAMPECSPSRVSFFTGRYPLRTGVLNITLDNTLANSQMSPFEATTPRLLREAGYKSGFFGKWHHTAFASNDQNNNPNPGNPMGNAAPRDMGWDYFEGMLEGAPRAIDTSAGGAAADGTYSCGFVDDASFGACYQPDGTCQVLGDPNDAAGPGPGRSCLESGGILDRNTTCAAVVPTPIQDGFENFNGYYVAPLLINHEDGRVELIAGFDDEGNKTPPTDPRARRYLTQQQTDAAIAWIQAQQAAGTPWMATLSYSSAHLPTQQPPRDLLPQPAVDSGQLDCTSLLGQRSLINQMVEALDAELARLLVAIGLASRDPDGRLSYDPAATDTMLVIVGDNGSYLQTVRLPFDPSRAKGTVYQTGVWVPLVASGPLVAPALTGAEVPHMVNAAVDLFSLFGDIAGIDVRAAVPASHALDSMPLLPYLTTPGQPALRKTNFTQTGTVLTPGGTLPHPCVLPVAGEQVCTQIFTFEELCETEGGTWYGDFTSCCDLKAKQPDITLLPYAASAIRDNQYKLVRLTQENCATNAFDVNYEFYAINEATPVPRIDRASSNLLSAPTLPVRGLNRTQLRRFRSLQMQLEVMLRSESPCPGDGNLDKVVNAIDAANWDHFAQACIDNPNRCSSVYDINLDGVTNEEDLTLIEQYLGLRCPGAQP